MTRRCSSAARMLKGAYEHLRARQVTVEPPTVAPYGMRQLYVKDPDGFTLCFQWPAEVPTAAATE